MVPKPPLPPLAHLDPIKSSTTTKQTIPAQKMAAVPRVIKKSKLPSHTKLKQRANSTIKVMPVARSRINRLLHIYNKQTGKKETL